MSEPSACRSCGAAIRWAVSANGKRTPLNEPAEQRLVAIEWLQSGTPVVELRQTWVPHFATCPDADRWRRRG